VSPSPAPSYRQTPRLRLAIAGLCLVAQAFALVHLFAVPHVRCAEHGELLHAGEAERELATSQVRAESGELGSADSIEATGLEIEAHEDDHCMALSERRDLRTHGAAQPAASPQALGELHHEFRAPLVVVRALYRLAPKISPPLLG
jgi:hypothetical protein